jgi:hypothetical protein
MTQLPKSIGLVLCDQVIFERETQKPSLIGCFAGKAVRGFPSGPQRFELFAALTDGFGDVTIEATATRLETDEDVYARRVTIRFPDPLRVVHLRHRVHACEFPRAGVNLMALSVADVEIAACRLRVFKRQTP